MGRKTPFSALALACGQDEARELGNLRPSATRGRPGHPEFLKVGVGELNRDVRQGQT